MLSLRLNSRLPRLFVEKKYSGYCDSLNVVVVVVVVVVVFCVVQHFQMKLGTHFPRNNTHVYTKSQNSAFHN